MKSKNIVIALFTATVLPTQAANSLTNALNTYTGSSQDNNAPTATQPTFLTTPPSGLEVSKLVDAFTPTAAFETIFFNPTGAVSPEFPGAKFGGNRGNGGAQGGGGDGRNFIRTVETDYNTKDFTAFVTVRRPAPTVGTNRRSVFFGLGTGQHNGGGNGPDQGTANASVFLELQNGFGNASRRLIGDPIPSIPPNPPNTTNQNSEFNWEPLTVVSNDAMRIRMTYNSVTATVTYAIDNSYDGLTFVADQLIDEENDSAPNTPVAKQTAEWATGDRASIYFGGDRSVVFTDLVITVTTPPTPPTPTGLSALSPSGVVNLTWNTLNAISGTTYSVYRSTSPGVTTSSEVIASGLTTPSYSDTTVVNGTTYYYRVTQSNTVAVTSESALSNEIPASPVGVAVTPTGVLALNGGKDALVVDWADLPTVDTYTVRRSTSAGGPFMIPSGGSGLTVSRFVDETVSDGTTYFYTVSSTYQAAESAPSAAFSAASRSLEIFVDFNNATPTYTGPGGLAAAAVGTTWNGIGLGAVANLSDSTSALSSVGLNATGDGTFSKVNGFGVGGDNTTVGSQTLTIAGGYDLMQDYAYANNKPTNTYTLTGLIPDRKYDLYLYGYGDALGQNTLFGASFMLKQTSNPAGLTTLTEGRHFVTFTTVADGAGKVEFTWHSVSGSNDADANSGSAVLNGFQLVENASALLQPLTVVATGTLDSVNLSWDAVDGAATYKVFRSTTRASGYTPLPPSVATLTYADTTATPGTTYYYVVKAVNGAVESFSSEEVKGVRTQVIFDADSDGLSDANEALIGTNPNDPKDFFKAKSSSVTPNGANYNVSFVINGAQGNYVIERSSSLMGGSWTEIAGSQVSFTWTTTGVLTDLNLSTTGLTPAPGGKEFFRAKGVVVPTP